MGRPQPFAFPRMDGYAMRHTPLRHAVLLLAATFAAGALSGCTIYASDHDGRWEEDGWVDRRPSASWGDGGAAWAVPAQGPGALPSSLVGQQVYVHLRRDAMGMSGAGMGVNVQGDTRDSFSVFGAYRGREGDWLRIERDGGSIVYIPADQVLAVETVGPGSTTQP